MRALFARLSYNCAMAIQGRQIQRSGLNANLPLGYTLAGYTVSLCHLLLGEAGTPLCKCFVDID